MVPRPTKGMMRRIIVILQLVIASASVFNVVKFRLDNLLAEDASELDRLALAALAAIALLTLAVVVLSRRKTSAAAPGAGFSAVLIALTAMTALTGFAHQAVYSHARAEAQAARDAERLQQRQAAARELLKWREDIDRRATEMRSFAPEQAYEFLDVSSSAGYWDDGADPLNLQALDLVRKALGSKLIDVNARIPGRRPRDETARPLFLQFYRERIEPFRHTLPRQDWEIMRLLAGAGADLGQADAASLVADLSKTPEPAAPSRFITLK